MSFESVLYRRARTGIGTGRPETDPLFRDFNLDQIFETVMKGKENYDLRPFFYDPLDDPDDITYRQEVMRDLEDPALRRRITEFAEAMEEIRSHLRTAGECYYHQYKQGWFLESAAVYCTAIRRLSAGLTAIPLRSRGLSGLREYLGGLVPSSSFATLGAESERLQGELRSLRYCLLIRDLSITVRKYDDEENYSTDIERVFAKFRQGEVNDYSARFPEPGGVGHVEAQIVELVAKLYPKSFARLEVFFSKHQDFVDPVVAKFDREIQFYIAYLQFIDRLKRRGLRFCYPQVGRQTKAVHGMAVFDLALADRLAVENAAPVVNDFRLDGAERVLVVSGPNQGGKTTFARTIGQLHYLASLGCPVPGTSARVLLCDRIFSHFDRGERVEDLRGKLQDDVLRIHHILSEATSDSLIVMNEIFSSTALEDAVFLASEIMRRVLTLDCLCVCVTFLDELGRLGEPVVSMVSTVVPEDPAQRTFKLVRRPADGRAYAMAIAAKYGLGYRSVKERLAS